MRSVWEYPVHFDGECIRFDGPHCHGYGYAFVNSKSVRAHRQAWEEVNGPIPDGLTVDHMCYTKDCINVEHLRLLTHSENSACSRASLRRKATTHCPKGHEYSGGNVYIDKRGARHCVKCIRANTERLRNRQKEERAEDLADKPVMCKNKLHEMTPENTRIRGDVRMCIACSRARGMKYYNKNKE